MPSGPWKVCLACEREIGEFEDRAALMECPNAFKYVDVIWSLMPSYSLEKGDHASIILREGGYDVSTISNKDGVWLFEIPIIVELAKRLMKHEAVKGERFHGSAIICADCVSAQTVCGSCGHVQHEPRCPICGTRLVPLS